MKTLRTSEWLEEFNEIWDKREEVGGDLWVLGSSKSDWIVFIEKLLERQKQENEYTASLERLGQSIDDVNEMLRGMNERMERLIVELEK